MSVERIKAEVAFRESGKYENDNQYNTISDKTNPDGTKDYGKYQVNENTLKEWSVRFLGKMVSVDEFLNSPELQERFMEKEIEHLYSLNAKKLDSFLILHKKGWGNISTARIRRESQTEEVQKYLNNRRYKTNFGTERNA